MERTTSRRATRRNQVTDGLPPSSPDGIPEPTDAERAVADLLPIAADERKAQDALARVPLWFHTFALGDGLYTPAAP